MLEDLILGAGLVGVLVLVYCDFIFILGYGGAYIGAQTSRLWMVLETAGAIHPVEYFNASREHPVDGQGV